MIGEINVVPVGSDQASMRRYVDKAVTAIRQTGVKSKVTEMGTNVEGSMNDILQAFTAAHKACVEEGAPRVMATLRVDDRRDSEEHLDG